jgi:hypothetical protein
MKDCRNRNWTTECFIADDINGKGLCKEMWCQLWQHLELLKLLLLVLSLPLFTSQQSRNMALFYAHVTVGITTFRLTAIFCTSSNSGLPPPLPKPITLFAQHGFVLEQNSNINMCIEGLRG